MIDRPFFKNVATYFGANILNGLVPFLMLPILARSLSVESFGEIAIFQTLLSAFLVLTGSTIMSSATRKFFDEDAANNLKIFIGSCIQVCLIMTLISMIVIYFTQDYIEISLLVPGSYLFYAVISAFFMTIIRGRLGQWQARNESSKYSILQVSQSLMIAISTILFLTIFDLDSYSRVLSQILVCSFLGILSLYLLARDGLLSFFSWNISYLKECLVYGIPLMPHVIGVFFLSMFDRLIIADTLGIDKSGIYMLAAQVSTLIAIVHESLNKAFLPWLFERLKKNDSDDLKMIVRITYFWFVAILVTCPVFFILGPSLINLIAGPRYEEAGEIFGWLALGHSFGGMYAMLNAYIYFSKNTYVLSVISISSGLLNVLLLLWLIPIFGLKGAAISFVIAMFTRLLMTWFAAQTNHPMPWLHYLKSSQIQ